MHDFEFQRLITIGQYMPTGSIIHRLDPRARMIAAICFLLPVTLTTHAPGLGIALLITLGGLLLARIPLGYALRGLLPPLPFLLLLAVLQVFLGPQDDAGRALLHLGPVVITTVDLWAGLTLVLRFAVLVLGLSLFSFCLSTSELLHGLTSLLRPLAWVGVPVHDFVLMVQVALRFLPLLAREAERIAKAQASRGADWGTGKGGLLHRARQVLPLLVPLFLTGLRQADALALAMEARGYSGRRRTSMVALHFGFKDVITVLFAIALAVVILSV